MFARLLLAGVTPAIALAMPAGPAHAQSFPEREIELVVPFPAGGGVDLTARRIAEGLSKALGQPVIVENKPGAGSLIGAEYVRRAKPDGYALLMASTSYVTNAVIGDRKPYDPLTDFAPITMVSNAPNILVTGTQTGITDLEDLIAKAKEQPDYLRYSSFGDRSAPDLASQLFEQTASVELQHIPYAGGSPAMTSVLSGETDVLFSSVLPVLTQIEGGSMKPLAVASAERLTVLPDVPTFHEKGLDFEIGTWFGVLAPAGTPQEIVAKIDETIQGIVAGPGFVQTVEGQGSEVLGLGPDEFAARLGEEVAFWSEFTPAEPAN